MADLNFGKDVLPVLFAILDNDPFITSQDLHLSPIYSFLSIIFDEIKIEDSIADPTIDLPIFNFLPSPHYPNQNIFIFTKIGYKSAIRSLQGAMLSVQLDGGLSDGLVPGDDALNLAVRAEELLGLMDDVLDVKGFYAFLGGDKGRTACFSRAAALAQKLGDWLPLQPTELTALLIALPGKF